MNLIQAIRKIFLKSQTSPCYEYVRENAEEQLSTSNCAAAAAGAELRDPAVEGSAEEIAFSHQGDLESYVRGLDLPKEAIERWISAGVLLPEETKVASQMIRILCKNR